MIEQGRAKYAYEKTSKKSGSSEYTSYVKKMPMMIKVNGLAQTIAFYESKGKEYAEVIRHIEGFLRREEVTERLGLPENINLLPQVCRMDTEQYRLVTYEIMELLGWMKRFVDAHAVKEKATKREQVTQ